MPGFTRVNGTAQPGSVYGLSPRYLKIATGNVVIATGNTAVNSNFARAVSAISSEASIITLGTPSANIFVVQVDASYGAAVGDSTGTSNLALSIKTAIAAGNAAAIDTVTITESTGFVGGAFAAFA